MSDSLERRVIQRDWLGHTIQLFGIFVVLGVPLLIWGISVNTAIATITQKVERHDRDMQDESRVQTIVNTQLTELTRQLTRIDTQLEDILRGGGKKK